MTEPLWRDARQIGILEWDHYHAYFRAKFGPPGTKYRAVRHEAEGHVEVSLCHLVRDSLRNDVSGNTLVLMDHVKFLKAQHSLNVRLKTKTHNRS